MSEEIIISVPKNFFLHAIYIIIILILAGLLAWSFLSGAGCDGNCDNAESVTGAATGNTQQDNAALEQVDETAETVEAAGEETVEAGVPSPDETCSDGIKNQDETNIDCGGICSDVRGTYFYGGSCHKEPEPELSGEVEFSINSVTEEKSPTSEFYKVTEVRMTIENGEKDRLVDPYVVFYVKSTSGIALNQFGDIDDAETPYGTFDGFGSVSPGDSVTRTADISGAYIFSQTGYSEGDDFRITAELYDGANDERIMTASETVRI